VTTRNTQNLPDTLSLPEYTASPAVDAPLEDAGADACIVPGITLGSYRIDSVLGEGGMGVVYKAYDTLLNRPVALKVLSPRLLRNRDFLHRFRTEAQAQARLNSPNVVTLYSLAELPVGLMLVMEYVEGVTLDQRIKYGPLTVDEALRVFDLALRGVESAHQMGIVHRDLKPANIFITTQNEIKIMDFGVAHILDNQEHTAAGSMLGTLLYIPPEQINGKPADIRSDIYTLGIGLFETVTGRLPFERKSDYGLMHAHILEKPPKPRTLRREVPKRLENVILKAIEKDPEKRYQSAREFREALQKQARPSVAMRLLQVVSPTQYNFLPQARYLSRFDRRDKKSRRLLNLGFDIALIAIVAGLAFSLGLFPGKSQVPAGHRQPPPVTQAMPTPATLTETQPAAQAESPPATQVVAEPVATPPRRQSPKAKPAQKKPAQTRNRNNAPAPVKKDDPSPKKYDALKKAWGKS
jgi:serine/threonine-protein kinase